MLHGYQSLLDDGLWHWYLHGYDNLLLQLHVHMLLYYHRGHLLSYYLDGYLLALNGDPWRLLNMLHSYGLSAYL